MSIFTSNAKFGDQLKSSLNSWAPGGSWGSTLRGAKAGMSQLGNSLSQSVGSWGRQPAKRQFGAQDFQVNDQSTRTPFGGSGDNLEGKTGGSFGAMVSTPQDLALSRIGSIRQQGQDSLTGRGPKLNYFEMQDLNSQAFDAYKRGMNWNGDNNDELDLAKVMDAVERQKANDYLERERMNGGGGGDFNWRTVKANEMSQIGGGHERAVAAGGRAVFADGNQQRRLFEQADAIGAPVSQSLRAKGGLMADVWDQQDQISGGDHDSRSFLKLGGMYGNLAPRSMGIGTNNTASSVYGGDMWDANSGANGNDRYLALNGPDWQWQKFHNGNLSFGGGNYRGSSPEQDRNRLSWYNRPQTWGPNYAAPRGEGYWQEGGEYPRVQREFYAEQRRQEDAEAQQGYRRPIYDTGDMPGSPYKRIRSGVMDVPNGGAVGAGRLSVGNDVFDRGDYGQASTPAPRMNDDQRMASPYRNFADGFDNGYYNAQNDNTFGMGNRRPRSFWMTR